MNIRKISLLFAFMFCFLVNAYTQNLLQHVPKDASFLITFNPGVLNQKVKIDDLKQFSFYKDMMKKVESGTPDKEKEMLTTLINEPSKFGMDLMSSSHVFGKIVDEKMYFAVLFKVSDKAAFNKLIEAQQKEANAKIMKKEGYELFTNQNMSLAWNGKMAMFAGGVNDLEGAGGKDMMIAPALIQTFIDGVINSKANNSIQTLANYKLSSTKKYDASLWIDYEWVQEFSQKAAKEDMAGAMGAMGPMYEKMMALYDDTYMFSGLNFDDGQIKLDSDMYSNDQMVSLWKNATSNPINKNFAKYIPKNNLGYYAMGLNIKGMVNELKKIFDPENTQAPMMETMATSMLKQQTGIEMTADQLYSMLKGDMVVAVTGMQTFEKKITTYEYDDEFNSKEVQKNVKEELPEFTMMMSYADGPSVMKFIELAEGMSVFKKMQGYYQADVPNSPMDMFLAMHDGILFVSNNKDIVTKNLKKGLPKKEQIGPKDLQKMVTNSQLLFWDIDKTLDLVSTLDPDMPSSDKWMVKNAQETFDNAEMKVSKVDKEVIHTHMNLDFKDKSTNSLELLFRFIDEIYMAQSGGTKM